MKLVGLLPCRNEDWVIRASAEIALQWLDALVILDHSSSDQSPKIIDELYQKYIGPGWVNGKGLVWILRRVDPEWDEMTHRQRMLECARRVGATHIAIVDADEILTSNLLGSIRGWCENLQSGEMLQLPIYNLRGSLNHYHETGIWGNRIVSVAFKDSPEINWQGDQFHHREPFGCEWKPVRPVSQGDGGILHLWGADLRRLIAKHALYKMTERIRWPEKPVSDIESLYNLWRGPSTNDPAWRIGKIPAEWWQAYQHHLQDIHLGESPWQEAECRRLYVKHGKFLFRGLDLFGCGEEKRTDSAPTFSLCHTTARIGEWQEAAHAWLAKCDHPENVEYILSTDEKDSYEPSANVGFGSFKHVVNTKRPCSVDGWNKAAQVSTGKFLINVADDIFPPEHWDTELLRAIPNINQDCVLDIDTGGRPGLLPFSFLSRKYLEKLTDRYGYEGGFFYPGYRGVYSDTEFTDLARRDGVVVNARHLFFEHQHPIFGIKPTDAIYARQNSADEYIYGKQIYDTRMQSLNMLGIAQQVSRFIMTICLPGESFSQVWVAAWTELLTNLRQNWDLLPIFSYCTNIYINRMTMVRAIMDYHIQPHLILWIDDDNIVTPAQVNLLIQDLNDHPEADGIVGWCYINRGMSQNAWGPSCGRFDSNGIGHALSMSELMEGPTPLKEIDWSGFPLFLMRREVLDKVGGDKAFLPMTTEGHPWGLPGEDLSFCHAAKQAGCKFLVDRRIKVRHLKLMDHGPQSLEETQNQVSGAAV